MQLQLQHTNCHRNIYGGIYLCARIRATYIYVHFHKLRAIFQGRCSRKSVYFHSTELNRMNLHSMKFSEKNRKPLEASINVAAT